MRTVATCLAALAALLLASIASAAAPGHSLPYLASCFPSHSTYLRALFKHSIDAVGSYGDPYASVLVVGKRSTGLNHLLDMTADRLLSQRESGAAILDLQRDTDPNSGSLMLEAAKRVRAYLEDASAVNQQKGAGEEEQEEELKLMVVEGLSRLQPRDTPRLNFLLRLLAGEKAEKTVVPVASDKGDGEDDIVVSGKVLILLTFDLEEHAQLWLPHPDHHTTTASHESSPVSRQRVSSFLKAVSRPLPNPLASTDEASDNSNGVAAPPDIRGTESLVKTYLRSLWANFTTAAAAAANDKTSTSPINAQARALTPEAVVGRLQQVMLLRPSSPPADWEQKAASNDRCRPATGKGAGAGGARGGKGRAGGVGGSLVMAAKHALAPFASLLGLPEEILLALVAGFLVVTPVAAFSLCATKKVKAVAAPAAAKTAVKEKETTKGASKRTEKANAEAEGEEASESGSDSDGDTDSEQGEGEDEQRESSTGKGKEVKTKRETGKSSSLSKTPGKKPASASASASAATAAVAVASAAAASSSIRQRASSGAAKRRS